MKFLRVELLLIAIAFLSSCASGYKMIEPKKISYASGNENNSIKLEYKYDLLDKKYAKKESKKGVKLVAIKVTNNSGKDLMFGKDIKLTYENGNEIIPMNNNAVFNALKQNSALYLLYLLLTPLTLSTGDSDPVPIGLIVGPGIAAGNTIGASSANKKFRGELAIYNLVGATIKNGETKHGLIGIKTNSYEALKLKVD